jgi:hypothetical protein
MMGALGFTTEDLANLRAAIASGSLIVRIGDREVRYRDQTDLIKAFKMVLQDLNGVSANTANNIQGTFSKGTWGSGSSGGSEGAL